MTFLSRAEPDPRAFVALETTLLAHGVPREDALPLAVRLAEVVREAGVEPAVVGCLHGRAIVGMTDEEIAELVSADAAKANAANLGVLLHAGRPAAATVSATMALAAEAGVRVFATGGIGGVHRNLARRLDISSDLFALSRYPVAVVASGTKGLLDVESTREALEALGVPVVGWRCDRFCGFYLRDSEATLDARFDDLDELAGFCRFELERAARGVLVCQPVPEAEAIEPDDWARWLAEAESRAAGARGRDITPAILAALHQVSGGATLRANLALAEANARLAARLCRTMLEQERLQRGSIA